MIVLTARVRPSGKAQQISGHAACESYLVRVRPVGSAEQACCMPFVCRAFPGHGDFCFSGKIGKNKKEKQAWTSA